MRNPIKQTRPQLKKKKQEIPKLNNTHMELEFRRRKSQLKQAMGYPRKKEQQNQSNSRRIEASYWLSQKNHQKNKNKNKNPQGIPHKLAQF